MMHSDMFYRISYLMKEEIRKYKWVECEKGRRLTWERARQEWTGAHQEKYEKFLMETLAFPDTLASKAPDEERQNIASGPRILPQNLYRNSG